MRKYNLFLSLLMVMFFSVGNVWADADVTYDFTGSGWSVSNDALTNGTVSFTGEGSANFKMSTGYFMLGKSGAYITFPAYSKAVEKIVVTGRSGASTSTKMNIFVGDATVSTETTGSTSANTYEIASASQVAGTIYTLKVTSNHNAQITKIEVFYVSEGSGDEPGGGDDPAPASSNWTKVEPGDLATNDIVVIVGNDSKAMSNDKGTSAAPTAVDVTVADDKLSADPADNIKWTVTVSNGSFEFATGDNHLYCTNTNNGVRVGTNENSAFTISEEGYLYNTATSRYVGVYNNADWRCYTSINTNIKDQTFSFFKESDGSTPKPAAGLAYAEADQKKLAKLGNAFTAPTLTNPHSVAVTYSSNNTDVAEVAANGAVTLKATGVATITASFAGNDDYKAGSASYTIGVTSHAGTEADPYVAADAKIAIDVKGTVENAYATGIVSNITTTTLPQEGYITFYFSADGLTAGQQIEAYKCYGLNSAPFEAVTDVKTGATVVVTGTLKKYNSTYEFDQNCHLVSYEAPAVPKTHIANDQANPYTVAQAITYAADGVTYDLDDYVYVQGVVYDVKNFSNGAMDIFIKDANAENQFELYKCAGINDGNATNPFEALTDVQVGDVVIGYGQLTVYNSVYEFKQGNYLVDLDREEVVLTDYYEKVTETAGITDGTYLIVYEEGSLAFNGGLETLDAANNTIEVAITNDHKIGVTQATEAATFFIDATAGTIQAANNKYIGVTSNSNGLKTSDEANAYSHNFSIDNDGNAIIAAAFEGSTMSLRYNTASNQARFRYYKDNGQQPIQLYKLANETVKANPELAWSAESVEITLGETFTAPTLDNPHSVAGITYASDNGALATVTSTGVISLVADATGTAHITATFAGNDDYKAANVSCTITVNSSTPTPAASGNVVIIAECDSKFYAMTNSLASGALAGVVVEKDGSTIVVSSADDKEAIQWTAAVSGNNTTLKDANNKYIKGSSGASLSLDEAEYNWNWDSEKSCYISSSYNTRGLFFSSTGNVFKGYALSNLESNGYAAIEVIEIDPENIVITSKVDPQLAYTPVSDEITIGDAWTAPTLGYVNGFDGLAVVTYASNNESVAVVTNAGVISLAGGIGTAVITASFAGNTNYLSGSATYTIVVNDIPDNCDGTDDFENEISGNTASSYNTRVTTNQWAAINAQWTTINNEQCYFTLNGKTTAVGKIQSPTLSGGIASLKVRYANTNSEANGVSFKVEIKQGEDVVREYTITKTNAEVSQGTVYTETITNINVEGDFLILITNLSPSNSTSNKDRLSIGKLCWTNYDTTPEPEPELNYVEARTELTVGKFYTICMPQNILGVRGATFWNLNNRDESGSMVYFVEAEAPFAAGKPYIFIATATTLEVAYGEENAGSPVANGALRGTFSAMNQSDFDAVSTANGNSPIYMLVNNQLRQVAGRTGNSLGANRAYVIYNELQAGEPTPAPGRRVLAMPMNENVATGIDALGSDAQPSKIIVNGQLFIIRDGKAYDATGRQVSKF